MLSHESPPACRLVISLSKRQIKKVESGAGLRPGHAQCPPSQTKPDRIPQDTFQPFTELTDNCWDVWESGLWHLIHSKTNGIDKLVCLAHLKSNH